VVQPCATSGGIELLSSKSVVIDCLTCCTTVLALVILGGALEVAGVMAAAVDIRASLGVRRSKHTTVEGEDHAIPRGA